MEKISVEQKILNHLMFGEQTIDYLWNALRPAMPPTVSRKLRKLVGEGKIEISKVGTHHSNVAYKLIK